MPALVLSPPAAPARLEDFSGLPPAYSFVGDGEPFYAETVHYFERLRAALDGLWPPVGRAAPPAAPKLPERALSVRAALFSPREQIPVENCAGRVAACDCSPCPPGVPVVMPGERIDSGTAAALRRYGVRTVCVLPLF